MCDHFQVGSEEKGKQEAAVYCLRKRVSKKLLCRCISTVNFAQPSQHTVATDNTDTVTVILYYVLSKFVSSTGKISTIVH